MERDVLLGYAFVVSCCLMTVGMLQFLQVFEPINFPKPLFVHMDFYLFNLNELTTHVFLNIVTTIWTLSSLLNFFLALIMCELPIPFLCL